MTVNSAYGGTAINAAYILQIDAKTINTAHILQIDGSHSAHGGPIRKINAAHILQINDGISGMSFVCLNTRACACWYQLARNAHVYMPIGLVLKGLRHH